MSAPQNNASNNLVVSVSIEASDEYQVQEITYDGTEKYVQPLSMSENLSRLAQRIDFATATVDDDEEMEESAESREVTSFQPSLWPWDSVRNKLKNSLTEVSVLLDVLKIVKEKKYMVLDPVVRPAEVPDQKQVAVMVAKKKALATAAQIVSAGAERLRQSQNDASRNRSAADFHAELMLMRQHWRMRKVGNTIMGDLSYRSVGSRFPHPGTFQITKNESPDTGPVGPGTTSLSGRTNALTVTIPPDLEGVAYIHVSVQKSNETLASEDFSLPLPASNSSHWQDRLESANNVLFCKEVFAQLAREAVQIQLPVPTIVLGNQIIATLFPGVQLFIALCHEAEPKPPEVNTRHRADHKPVLEHSLHQLLREMHHKLLHHPMPHPVTATLGLSRKRMQAGPEAYDKVTLSQAVHTETSLEQLIAQAQHVILKIRTLHMIDTLARDVRDPCIAGHWMCLNSPTKSSVKVNIVSLGYESLCRTPLVVHIESTGLRAICREGRVIRMSYESQELRYLLLSQVSLHQVNATQALAKMMGWRILAFTSNCGVGPVEMIGTASSLVLASPNGERVIALRHGPESGVHVSISSSPQEQVFYPSTLVKDMKWQNVAGSFREVALERIEGRNLISKMEYLMASLTPP